MIRGILTCLIGLLPMAVATANDILIDMGAGKRPLRYPMEQYVAVVVASEMPVRWPIEALKAQAVAARTYALHRQRERQGEPFHVSATVQDQAFDLSAWKKLTREQKKRVFRAVQASRGFVLLRRDSRLGLSHYHSHCGGHTESAKVVWPSLSASPSVRDLHSQPQAWNLKVSWHNLYSLLEMEQNAGRGQIRLASRSPSGRVQRLRVSSRKGSREISGSDLRRLLGSTRLKSTAFDVALDAQGVRFSGKGHGHGVGLCQWGAQTLAKRGWGYQEILGHYYPHFHLGALDAHNHANGEETNNRKRENSNHVHKGSQSKGGVQQRTPKSFRLDGVKT